MCHEDFWKRIDKKEIIERTFLLDTYWVKNDGLPNSNEFMPFAAELSLSTKRRDDYRRMALFHSLAKGTSMAITESSDI